MTWSQRASVAVGTMAILGAVPVSALKINWWPLTSVYMYSSYYSAERGIRRGYPHAAYFEAADVQRIAREFRDERISFDAKEYLPLHAELRLAGDGIEPFLFETGGPGVVWSKQWDLVIELPVLIADLASKPAGRIAFDPAGPETDATRFLAGIVPLVHRDTPGWERYRTLELTYLFRDGEVVLASVPLHPTLRNNTRSDP